MGVFKKIFYPSSKSKLEQSYRLAERVAYELILNTSSKKIARQHILEELDAARQGDDVAQIFAKESGIVEAAYTGAIEYTPAPLKNEVESLENKLRISLQGLDMEITRDASLKTIDFLMRYWKLGKYRAHHSVDYEEMLEISYWSHRANKLLNTHEALSDVFLQYRSSPRSIIPALLAAPLDQLKHCIGRLEELTGVLFDEEDLACLQNNITDFEPRDIKEHVKPIPGSKIIDRSRLIDIIPQGNLLEEGIFATINRDLHQYDLTTYPPMIMMSYAYSLRTAAAGLVLQGIFTLDDYRHASKIFNAWRLQTEHSKDFQTAAYNQAAEYIASYDKRLSKKLLAAMTSTVELNEGKPFRPNRPISYEMLILILQRITNKGQSR